jgi:hypothetical protein
MSMCSELGTCSSCEGPPASFDALLLTFRPSSDTTRSRRRAIYHYRTAVGQHKGIVSWAQAAVLACDAERECNR